MAWETIAQPLRLDDADIPDGVDLTSSRARLLSFEGSRIGSYFTAQAAQIDDDLLLSNATVRGICNINSSTIRGPFAAVGATFENPDGDAINAQSSTLGALFLSNATVRGICDIAGSTFAAVGATFENPDGDAINAQSSTLGALFLSNATVRGICDIAGSTIAGEFAAVGATFENPDGDAINAQSSTLGALFLSNATVRGICDIAGSTIAGPFEAVGATFENPDGDAINADSSTLGALFLDNATVRGICDIAGSTIAGPFEAVGATFENPDGRAIDAQSSTLGALFLRSEPGDAPQITKIAGTVVLTLAEVEADADFAGTEWVGGRDGALAARHLRVKGNVNLSAGARIEGALRLSGARIDGRLDLAGSRIVSRAASTASPPGWRIADDPFVFTALDLSEAQAGQLRMPDPADPRWPTCARLRGIVDLSRARIGTLTDFASGWPEPAELRTRACPQRLRDADGRDADHLVLDGLEYQHLDNPEGDAGERAHVARLRWLRAQSCDDLFARLKPQPWQHLAKSLAAQGYEDEARRIAIERRVAQRYAADMGGFARFVIWSLHQLADYGFNPWKSVAWSCGVIVICAAIYANLADAYCGAVSPACHNGEVFMRTAPADFVPGYDKPDTAKDALAKIYPAFDPLAYSLDVFLPFFDIGTERFWRVNTTTPWGLALYWFTVIEQIAGAFLVSLTVTGFTGLLTRNET